MKVYWFICCRAAYPGVVPTVAANQADFNRRTANAIGGLLKSRHEVGDLLARPVSTAIKDHLLCDGSEVSRLQFPQLYAVIGTEWGEGTSTETFKLPNLLGETLPNATEAPTQTVESGTVSTGTGIQEPITSGQTGGSTGGNVVTGGNTRRPRTVEENFE